MTGKTEIQKRDPGEGQNRQAHMKVKFYVVVKKFTDPYHWTKVSVKC